MGLGCNFWSLPPDYYKIIYVPTELSWIVSIYIKIFIGIYLLLIPHISYLFIR